MARMPSTGPPVRLPDAPALVAGVRGAVWLSPDGEIETLAPDQAARRLGAGPPPLVCHARATARRLGTEPFRACDLLELFAFVRPARFCLPTPRGLAEALGVALPGTLDNEAESLIAAARLLLGELAAAGAGPEGARALGVAWAMARGGWPWGTAVVSALTGSGDSQAPHSRALAEALKVWRRLPDWEEGGAEGAPENWPVEPDEARTRLDRLIGAEAEDRPEQAEYAATVSAAFLPRERRDAPRVVLAEAGTGVGKTLGYIAPASVWAEKNEGPVWISTFTRNLQRQLDSELDRLYPDPDEKAGKVVIRKGRENYFCLLNFAEAVARMPARGGTDAVALGLMARWALASRDGDMVGGDFPAWLADLLGRGLTVDLTDSRGECIYSACDHYRKCFIEGSIRRARRARIVVANHALVMVQAARGGGDGGSLPTRYVIDEGHHVFDAADGTFSAHLTGMEAAELRRWIVGAEDGARSRARGLRLRIEGLVDNDDAGMEALQQALKAGRALPGPGWRQRVDGGAAVGPAEAFLALVHQQVYARVRRADSPYSLESGTRPPVDGLLDAAQGLETALARLGKPLAALCRALSALLDVEADELETTERRRVEAMCRSLERWRIPQIQGWRDMLRALDSDEAEGLAEGDPEDGFVDWFGVERVGGHDRDVGLHRHWVDPTRPFAEAVIEPAHGVLVTSATLRDGTGDADADWAAAIRRTGAHHLPSEAVCAAVPSPFDYAGQTRVLVVTDVDRTDAAQVSAAYRELFVAAGGGALGLFTAIRRLRRVFEGIKGPLDEAGLKLMAQHVDAMDTGTLIDIFRAEDDACLLGTDAVRDGIDVPGRSLRLIVFDRVPWPRPDILHRARKRAFGGRAYDEMLTRLRLKQAYGRLVRGAGDRGVFVLLDRALPSRLAGAFPDGVEVRRVGLADAVRETRAFLAEGEP
ncbi:MAG: ATP-dependent DNA helicase [Rhodospirillales bacterium]